MEVILLERVRNLGKLGDRVSVKSGYARNYLIPQSKAVLATKSNIAQFEERRAELEKVAAEALAAAEKRAAQLSELVLTLVRKTSDEEGHLYGSVGVQEIFDELQARNLEIEKRELNMPEGPIRTIGEFVVEAHVHSEVVAKVKVQVEADK